jgi:hypothetical protein
MTIKTFSVIIKRYMSNLKLCDSVAMDRLVCHKLGNLQQSWCEPIEDILLSRPQFTERERLKS